MEQAQRLAAHPRCRRAARSREAMPRLRDFKDISHYTVEINRLENEGDRDHARGDRVAVRRRHRPDGRDPLEGHLRAARGGDRRDRAASRTSSRASSSRTRERGPPSLMDGTDLILVIVVATALAFDFTNGFHDTANVVATSISTRALPPRVAVRCAAILNFVGAFLSLAVAATIANGIVDPDAGHADDRLRRPRRRDRLEPRHVVLRAAVELVARADRRRRRRDARRRRARARSTATGCSAKVLVPALIAPVLAFVVAGIAILVCLPDRRPARARARSAAASGSGQVALRRPARARARHERRAEDDGRHHARADRQRQPRRRRRRADLGRRLAPRPRSRSAPTSAAGGSSDDGHAASSRWTRRRASRRRAPARR